MARTTNTVPYTNARRAGRTAPGLIEMITELDPRFRFGGVGPISFRNGREARRASGLHSSHAIKKSASCLKVHRTQPCAASESHRYVIPEDARVLIRGGVAQVAARCTKCDHCTWKPAGSKGEGR